MSTPVLFQTMPPLSADEYANLEQSIREHGIQVPIMVDEEGVVIDGHHRQMIAEALGVNCPVEVKFGMDDAEKRSLSLSLNIDRRQLSREQRRSIIENSLRADPELSDREHAKRTGVSPTTVGTVRGGLEESGELSKLDSRVSADGRERPATQPERHQAAVQYADPTTGEITDRPLKITETETVTRVSEPVQIPRALAPVLTGAAAERKNDEDLCAAFGRTLLHLEGLTHVNHRAWIISAWPAAHEVATPDAQALANPTSLRALAGALIQLADEWENN